MSQNSDEENLVQGEAMGFIQKMSCLETDIYAQFQDDILQRFDAVSQEFLYK